MSRLLVLVLFVIWAALVAYGAYSFFMTDPTDSGFTRGLNRAGELFKWQGFALGVALIAWVGSRGSGASLWAGRLPLILSGGFFLVVAVLLAGALIFPG